MALSLQQEQQNQEINWEEIPEGISDLELAKKLQEEEDRRASQFYQEQERAAAAAVSAQPQVTVTVWFLHVVVNSMVQIFLVRVIKPFHLGADF